MAHFFFSQPAEPSRVAEKEVRECDVFVGLYAHRFGFVPGGQAKSLTQQEYELARQLKKDCLCFIVQKGFAWNPELIEFDKYAPLSNWLHNSLEPMLVIEAIGGMGKTALSWVWLQQEVLAKNAELDGVLWWSFYDEPFEAFLPSLFLYTRL